MKRDIEIFVVEPVTGVTGAVPKPIRQTGPAKQVFEIGVDEALAAARKIVVDDLKMNIRSINITTNGSIRVVVRKPERSITQGFGGRVYKRPARTS